MYMKHSVIVAAAALGFSTLGQIAFAGPAPFAGETAYQAQPAFTQVSNHSADAWRIRRYCRHHPGRCDAHGGYDDQRSHSDLVWSRCYIKCIMSGHPDDYCQGYNWHFCY